MYECFLTNIPMLFFFVHYLVEHLRSRSSGRPADVVQVAGERGRLRGAHERGGCRIRYCMYVCMYVLYVCLYVCM